MRQGRYVVRSATTRAAKWVGDAAVIDVELEIEVWPWDGIPSAESVANLSRDLRGAFQEAPPVGVVTDIVTESARARSSSSVSGYRYRVQQL